MPPLSKKRLSKIARRKLEIRSKIWPDLDESRLWDRQTTSGWLTIPRPMPLLLRIMDVLAPKGQPISAVFLDLWCRTFEDSFVIASKPREMAFYSGFKGERAERTWGTRIRILADLGFIDFKPGTSGPIHYLLILNPYKIIKQHHEAGDVTGTFYNALLERAIEIRANDLDDEKPKGPASRQRKGVRSKPKKKSTGK